MKRALLIGCNYFGTKLQTTGNVEAIELAKKMYALRLHVTDFIVLVDVPGSSIYPTHANIEESFDKLVLYSQPGDTLIVHYCGSSDACMVSSDLKHFSDADFRYFIDGVQEGVKVFCVLDSDYSDIVAQLRFTYEDDSKGITEIVGTSRGKLVPNVEKWSHRHKTHENLSDSETSCPVVLFLVKTWVLFYIFDSYHLHGISFQDALTFSRSILIANNSYFTPVLETGQLTDITSSVGSYLNAPM
jgi:hypothetical protein